MPSSISKLHELNGVSKGKQDPKEPKIGSPSVSIQNPSYLTWSICHCCFGWLRRRLIQPRSLHRKRPNNTVITPSTLPSTPYDRHIEPMLQPPSFRVLSLRAVSLQNRPGTCPWHTSTHPLRPLQPPLRPLPPTSSTRFWSKLAMRRQNLGVSSKLVDREPLSPQLLSPGQPSRPSTETRRRDDHIDTFHLVRAPGQKKYVQW